MNYEKLRPKQIRVNGKIYKILFNEKNPLVEYDNHGHCDNTKHVIHVEGEQVPIEELDTLIHEMLHAVWYQMTLTDIDDAVEERIVAALGTGVAGLIADNPKLLDYFKAVLAAHK